jgi:hypothetical protein
MYLGEDRFRFMGLWSGKARSEDWTCTNTTIARGVLTFQYGDWVQAGLLGDRSFGDNERHA